MNDKEEELRKALAGSRAILRMLKRVDCPHSWGIELQRYAALLGQVQPHWFKKEKNESP